MPGIAFVRVGFLNIMTPSTSMPQGILQLASVFEAKNIPVISTLDLTVTRPRHMPRLLTDIANQKPDMIGLSAFSLYLSTTQVVAAFFKKLLPDVPVVVGGPIASADTQGIMEDPNVDFAIAGEGEESLPALYDALLSGSPYEDIPGLIYRKVGELIANKPKIISMDLDDLPFPAWDRVDFKWYGKFFSQTIEHSPYATIMTSRGCPYGCIYCHNIFGRKVRLRSVENVLDEFHFLRDRYGIRRIEIIDDYFNVDLDRGKEIMTRIKKELPGTIVGLGNGLRLDKLDEEFIKLMADVNCNYVGVPVETATPRLQKLIHKNLDLEKAEESIRLFKKYKIFTCGYYMIGFPTETPEEMIATIEYAEKLDLDFSTIFTASPYSGTKFREMLGTDFRSDDLGNIFVLYREDAKALTPVMERQAKIYRDGMKKPINWGWCAYFLWWRLWWAGPVWMFKHLVSVARQHNVPQGKDEREQIALQIRKLLLGPDSKSLPGKEAIHG